MTRTTATRVCWQKARTFTTLLGHLLASRCLWSSITSWPHTPPVSPLAWHKRSLNSVLLQDSHLVHHFLVCWLSKKSHFPCPNPLSLNLLAIVQWAVPAFPQSHVNWGHPAEVETLAAMCGCRGSEVTGKATAVGRDCSPGGKKLWSFICCCLYQTRTFLFWKRNICIKNLQKTYLVIKYWKFSWLLAKMEA